MKRLPLCLSCLLVLCLLLPPQAMAHSGRTDASGGHRDNNNVSGLGGYHYHHGYPAHLHPNGVCPYAFDDQTGKSSGGTTSGSDSTGTAKPTPRPTPAPKPETSDSGMPSGLVLLLLALGAGAVFFLRSWAVTSRNKRRQRQQFQAERARYTALYGGKTINELARLAGMPDGVEIGPDGLPKETGSYGWGRRFTYYAAPSGQVFHSVPTCNHAATRRVHACHLADRRLRPCSRCRAAYPDLTWYRQYQAIRRTMQNYGIPVAPPPPPLPPRL